MKASSGWVALALIGAAVVACGGDARKDLIDAVAACDTSLKVPGDVDDFSAECALDCLDDFGCVDLETKDESCVYNCDVDLWGESNAPETSFGEDKGSLSTSADELLAKPAGNPDPQTLVGVFELTGYGSEDHPDDFLIASNTWRVRREHRQDGVAMAIECLIDVGGATSDTRTLTAFAQSPIETYDWGIRILEAASDKAVYTDLGFNIECSVDLPQVDMPYCVPSGIPEGYSICVEVTGGHLYFHETGGGTLDGGKKISD